MSKERKISISVKNTVALFALAVLMSCLGTTLVNLAVNQLMPQKTVRITVGAPAETGGNEVWIFEDWRLNNLFTQCKNGAWEGNWEYRDAIEYGYAGNMICSYGDNRSASISFFVPVSASSYLMFWKNASSGSVRIETDGMVQELNLYSDAPGGEMEWVFFFEDSYTGVVYKVIAYGVLTLLLFAGLLLCWHWLSGRLPPKAGAIWRRPIKWWYVFPLWAFLFLFAVFQYKKGIPNFLEFGDQLYYWNTSLLTAGQWNPKDLAAHVMSFRGYLSLLAPTIAQVAGPALQIDSVHIYFLFTSGALAWMAAYVLPGLYRALTGRQAALHQFAASLIVYLFFWNGTLTAVLMDLMGAVAFLSGVLFAIRFWQSQKPLFGILTGFFWAAACNLRLAYQYGIFVLGGFAIVLLIVRIWKGRKNGVDHMDAERLKQRMVSVLAGGVGFALALLLVCSPQMQINVARGHPGLLPYDFDGAWVELDFSTPASLLESSGNMTLSMAYDGYPYGAMSDDQLFTMKTQLYEQTKFLTIPQLLSVYANSPAETFSVIGKKMFVAFAPKTSVTYPLKMHWRESSGLAFAFFNFVVFGTALYTLFLSSSVQRREQLLVGAFFLGLILPQMFVHVEWRYFLASYTLFYYFFAYHFVGEILCQPENWREFTQKNYLPYLAVFVFIAQLLNQTLSA